jgi:hypothetical protein
VSRLPSSTCRRSWVQCCSAATGTAEGWSDVLGNYSTGPALARDLSAQLAATLLDVAVAILDGGEAVRQGSPSDTGREGDARVELGRAMPLMA